MENLIITKANKGSTMVIMEKFEYAEKLEVDKDPTRLKNVMSGSTITLQMGEHARLTQ
jgi:hypothetical protein